MSADCSACVGDDRDTIRSSIYADDGARAASTAPSRRHGEPRGSARLPARDPEPRRLVRRDGGRARPARLRRLPARPARLRAQPRRRAATSSAPAQLVDDVAPLRRARAREHDDGAPVVPRRRLLGRAAGDRVRARARRTSSPGSRSSARRSRRKVDLPPRDKLAVFAGRLVDPSAAIRIPLEPELFTAQPAVPRVHPQRPAQPARGDGALLLPAVRSGTGGCSRATSLRLPLLAAPGRATTRSSTASASARWFERLRAPRQALRPLPRLRPHPRLRGGAAALLGRPRRLARRGRRSRPSRRRAARRDRRRRGRRARPSSCRSASRSATRSPTRSSSTNVVARVALDDGTVGYGEGVPREYVTGETVEGAVAALAERLVPALLGARARRRRTTCRRDRRGAPPVAPDGALEHGRALRARARRCSTRSAGTSGCSVQRWLGGAPAPVGALRRRAPVLVAAQARRARAARSARSAIRQVKIKVGDDLERELALARAAAPRARPGRRPARRRELRLDGRRGAARRSSACARYRISAVEQPLAGDDLDGLRAAHRRGARGDHRRRVAAHGRGGAQRSPRRGACDAFNIRVSKCGGLLAVAADRADRARAPASSASSARRSARAGSSRRRAATSPPRSARRATSRARAAACC